MFGKKKPDPEPEIPAGCIRDPETGEVREKYIYELNWQELGYKSEADYRMGQEDVRVRMGKAKQRQEQHDYNKDVLYRMGFPVD